MTNPNPGETLRTKINLAMLLRAIPQLPTPEHVGQTFEVKVPFYLSFNEAPALCDSNTRPRATQDTFQVVTFIVERYVLTGQEFLEWEILL